MFLIYQALQQKYESVQAAMLTECLIHQHGEPVWSGMGDRERQGQLQGLVQRVEGLRREGRSHRPADQSQTSGDTITQRHEQGSSFNHSTVQSYRLASVLEKNVFHSFVGEWASNQKFKPVAARLHVLCIIMYCCKLY